MRRAGESAATVEVPQRISGSVLVELLRRLSLLDDPEQIADLVAEAARDLVRAERAYFLVFDAEKEELWAREPDGAARRYESAAVGLVSFVLRSGLPVRVPRAGEDPRYDRSADDPLGRGDERCRRSGTRMRWSLRFNLPQPFRARHMAAQAPSIFRFRSREIPVRNAVPVVEVVTMHLSSHLIMLS